MPSITTQNSRSRFATTVPLIDVPNSLRAKVMGGFDAAAANFSDGFAAIGYESNPQSRDTARLAEAVIRNRGLATGCLFDNVADARHWLAESRLS